jgi:hypothetical protein
MREAGLLLPGRRRCERAVAVAQADLDVVLEAVADVEVLGRGHEVERAVRVDIGQPDEEGPRVLVAVLDERAREAAVAVPEEDVVALAADRHDVQRAVTVDVGDGCVVAGDLVGHGLGAQVAGGHEQGDGESHAGHRYRTPDTPNTRKMRQHDVPQPEIPRACSLPHSCSRGDLPSAGVGSERAAALG